MISAKDAEKGGIDSVAVERPTFKEGEDPINYLGFGITSYFQMIRTFMIMFLLMTLLNVPIMALYVKSGAYNDQPIAKSPVKISLGALGFSQSRCFSTGVATDKIYLSCHTGKISNIVDLGFIAKFEDRDQCVFNKSGACAASYNRTKILADFQA